MQRELDKSSYRSAPSIYHFIDVSLDMSIYSLGFQHENICISLYLSPSLSLSLSLYIYMYIFLFLSMYDTSPLSISLSLHYFTYASWNS